MQDVGGKQKSRDAGNEKRRKGRILKRRETGKEGLRKGMIHERMNSVKGDSGKEGCRKER